MHGKKAAATSVKLVIPSDLRLVDLVHSASEKIAEVAGFNADDGLNVGLAVREAVINAIVHGNREDPGLEVQVTLTAGSDGLEAKIRDQGGGFDPSETPDPTAKNRVLETSGRGLLLMKAFVDDVRFHRRRDDGMEITLTKNSRRNAE
jgi:serine/threonine-protein kinase RsbW